MKVLSHATAKEALEVVRLGRTDWRINDGADPELLLGYIERQASGRYEVLWMSDPLRWGYVDTFEDALEAFVVRPDESSRFTGDVFDRRASAGLQPARWARAGRRRSTWV